MITLDMINQYALDNNLGDDTDIFYILSQMQLEMKERTTISNSLSHPSPPASVTDTDNLVEYSTQDVLDLFST